mgnify:CR=1 FL=1
MSAERIQPGNPQAQMSFDAPFVERAAALELRKRDGERVPFDKERIALSIAQAAAECGESDSVPALDLANAVALYLVQGNPDGDHAPTTQSVSEAIEKVLLEMGHARVAVAYARYRDRRARRRDLEHAGTVASPRPARADAPAISVWRSDDAVAPWDREQVAAILVREADLTRKEAASIAVEVEELIVRGGIQEVSTALIRELAGARLIERGLHDARTRHARLGVPLYDAEQIIGMPGVEGAAAGCGPRDSDRMLAERVKREYALTRVFNHEVAEAHLDGTLHLSGLGQVDRLDRMTLSPDWVARFGAPRPGHAVAAAPPTYVEPFVVHLARTHAVLSDYAVSPVAWDAVNVHAAPFVAEVAPANLRRAAQWILTEFLAGPPAVLHLHWNVPAYLAHAAPRQGGSYADYEGRAREVLVAILEEALDGDACGGSWRQPEFVLHISQAMLASQPGRAALRLASRAAAEGSAVSFQFARGGEQLELGTPPWQPVRMVAHAVTLNLPRAIYQAGARMDLLHGELNRVMDLAVAAHMQKQTFLKTLIGHGDSGPLGLLARAQEAGPWLNINAAEFVVGVAGLAEGVRYLQRADAVPGMGALDVARMVLTQLREAIDERAEDTGLAVRLDGIADGTAAERLATLDLEDFHESAVTALGEGRTRYAIGARLHDRTEADTLSDFALHPCFHDAAEGRILIADDGAHGADGVAAWLQRLFAQTDCQQVRFEVG